MQEKEEVIGNTSGRGYWVYTCNERPQGRFRWLRHVPLSIYSWRGGVEERREDRIGYVHVTQEEGISKQQVVNLSIRVNRLALPEGGERKRNLTTTGLGEKQQKWNGVGPDEVVSESSQNPLSSSRRRERARQWRSNVQRSSNDDPRRGTARQR